MKKLLLSLLLVAFATSINAQTVAPVKQEVKKECCKDHKDGKKCDKPADQQCPDCKAQAAAGKQCDKAAMKHECKDGMKKCDKAEAMKHECKEGKKDCKKAEAMKHDCKKAAGKQCEKADAKKDCCKDKKMDGKKCDKPADQQCPDCKEKAKKN